MPDVIEVTNQDELEARRLVWKSLLGGTRGANVCHAIDWIHLAMEHNYPQEWRILFVYSGRKPVGILLLTLSHRATHFGTFRVLGYPQPLHAPNYSPIGPNPTATLAAAMRHVEAKMNDWDVLELGPVSPCEHDHQRTPTAMRLAGMEARTRSTHLLPTLDLLETDKERLKDLANELNRSQQELEASFGSARFQRFRPTGRAYGDGELPTESLARHESPAGDPEESEYVTRIREMAMQQGCLDFTRLQAGDRTLASTVAFYSAGHLTEMRCWVDPQLDFDRLSQALMTRLLLDSHSRGDEKIFLADQRLLEWANSQHAVETYTFVRRSSYRARAANWLPQSWSVL